MLKASGLSTQAELQTGFIICSFELFVQQKLQLGDEKKKRSFMSRPVSRVMFFFLSGSQNYLKNWVEEYFEHMIFNVKNS